MHTQVAVALVLKPAGILGKCTTCSRLIQVKVEFVPIHLVALYMEIGIPEVKLPYPVYIHYLCHETLVT